MQDRYIKSSGFGYQLRRLAVSGVGLMGVATSACIGGDKTDADKKTPDDGASSQSSQGSIDLSASQTRFLELPFKQDSGIRLVQGWVYKGYHDGQTHYGIDYIQGNDLDNAAIWGEFPVLASADGVACEESFVTIYPTKNQAVKVLHKNGYTTRNLHMDPASVVSMQFPKCSEPTEQWKPVKMGEELGLTGDTGTEKGWFHLHFEVKDPNGNPVDPYDLRKKRDEYPDPSIDNGKDCGPNLLWVNCPTGTAAEPATPIPPTATFTPTPLRPSPGPKPEAATPTKIPAPEPTPTPTKTPTQPPVTAIVECAVGSKELVFEQVDMRICVELGWERQRGWIQSTGLNEFNQILFTKGHPGSTAGLVVDKCTSYQPGNVLGFDGKWCYLPKGTVNLCSFEFLEGNCPWIVFIPNDPKGLYVYGNLDFKISEAKVLERVAAVKRMFSAARRINP